MDSTEDHSRPGSRVRELPLLLTPREFAEHVGMRLEWLHLLWAQGRGPERARRGKHVYVTRDEAERWLRVRDQEAAQTAKATK